MAKKIINQIICTVLIAALLVPSFEVSVKAEEVTEEEISEELIIDDEILEDEIIGDEIIEDEPAEELIIPVVEFDCEDSEETIAEDVEIVLENDSEEPEDASDLFFGYREIPVEVEFERLSDVLEDEGDISLMGELPSSYITPNLPLTRDQGSYGSCWAHTAMACAEINQGSSLNDYSELHYAYFVYNTPSDPLGGLDGDSNGFISSKDFLQFGGDTVAASPVLSSWVGPAYESAAPYSDAPKVLNGSKTISTDIAYSDAVHIRDYYLTDPAGDRETTKRLIMECGAVAASFYALKNDGKGVRDNATGDPYFYEDAWNQSTNAYYLPATTGTNHAITLVGWDDNYSASNFVNTPSKNGAWLVRNSWESGQPSSSRGYKTYFWLSYCDNSIHDNAVAYVTESADKYDNNYQYDGAMTDTGVRLDGSVCMKGANVFTASVSEYGEKLEAVSFATPNALANYTIEIYKGVNGEKPTSGTLSATLTGTAMYPGYHTIELDNPLLLEKGEKFSVVVYFDNPLVYLYAERSLYSQGYDDKGNLYSWNITSHIDEGESYYGYANTWIDCAKADGWGYGNFRIKAFTTNNDSPVPKYTVSFDANEGSCTVTSKQVTLGKAYGTLPAPTRTGYDFAGWYTEKSGGTQVTDSTIYNISGNSILYAHWTPKSIKVSFCVDGKTSDYSPIFVTYGNAYGTLPIPSQDGYKFAGWYDKSLGGNQITADTIVTKTADHILYARWAKSITITFDANGGTVNPTSKSAVTGETYGTLPTPTRDGYSFAGWYNGGFEVTESTVISSTSNHSLTAHWNPNNYTVSFNANGGSCSTSSKSVTFNSLYGTLPTPTRTGYSFDGWYNSKNVKITDYSTVTIASDHTLTAHWTVAKCTVSFDANGGSSVGSVRVTYGEKYGDLPTPTKRGYFFDGWFTERSGGTEVTKDTVVTKTSNHTLYARWNAITFEISFDPNGGMCYTESKQVTFDSEYGELPITTRSLWDFAGWYTEPEGGILITAESVLKYAGNQTLYAHWTDRRGEITEEDRNDLIKKYGEEFAVPQGLWIAGLTTYEEESGWIPKKFTYTASQIKPEIRVYDGNKLLKEKTDYTVTFKNNVNVATADQTNAKGVSTAPTVVVTGKGNYKGSDSATFEIVPKSIEDEDVIISEPATVLFNKKDQKPVPAITYGKSKLSTKKDYSVRYYLKNLKNEVGENPELYDFANKTEVIPRDAGTYYILLTANEGGNYCGYDVKTFTIGEPDKVLVSKLKVNKIPDKQYTGLALYPEEGDLVIKNGKETLRMGIDYKVSYITGADYTNIGTVKAVITGLGKYAGSREITYKIVGRQMKSVTIENFVKSFGYDGSEKVQDNLKLTFKDKGEVEPEVLDSDDYVVSYSNNINAGTATMILTGINGYTGVVKKTFKINPYVINSADEKLSDLFTVAKLGGTEYDSANIPCFKYEKSSVKPVPVVTYNGVVLNEGKDYTVSYLNNTNVNDGSNLKKMPTVKITGKGNFKGTDATTFFTISQAKLNDESVGIKINVPDKVFANKAGNWKSAATVTDAKGKKLAEKTDYTVRYSYVEVTNVYDGKTKSYILRTKGETVGDKDLVPAGTEIRVTITGAGKNYAAGDDFALSGTYRIVPKDIGKLKASIKDVVYTGKDILPDKADIIFSGETPNDDEYEIIAYANNVNKGKASVTIRGLGDNYGGSKTINFNIVTKKFSWWPW